MSLVFPSHFQQCPQSLCRTHPRAQAQAGGTGRVSLTRGDGTGQPHHRLFCRLGCCNLTAAGCRDLGAVLGAMPSLAQLDLSDNPVEDGGVQALCEALAGPSCGVQKLWLWQCRLTEGSCGALAAVLPVCPSLRELHLGVNDLGDGGVRRLSEGLRDPACRLQALRYLESRGSFSLLKCPPPHRPQDKGAVSVEGAVGTVPAAQQAAMMMPLSSGHAPHRLWQCRLTEGSCGALAAVLPVCPSLRELHLGDNELRDGGVRQLSEGLRDPGPSASHLSWSRALEQSPLEFISRHPEEPGGGCAGSVSEVSGSEGLCVKRPNISSLQRLPGSLWKCQLTGACCQDLCAVLSTSRSLEHLDLSENNLGDGGMRLLCEPLGHPTCALQRLWLKKSGLNEETLQKLGALKEIKPKLYIGYI
uniref:Uncharacterized protein n=1 Tax=Strix occidentalis caurina TaxID=311401 RepID=A0A8D0FQ47_STROC